MKKILVYILICVMGASCAACTRGSSTSDSAGKMTERMPEPTAEDAAVSGEQTTGTEPQSKTESEPPKETETDSPQETRVHYELHTVEVLEDDGKELSAAEALRSAMKGTHSALEVHQTDRMFYLGLDYDDPKAADSVKDMPDEELARINMLDYNSGSINGVVTSSIPVKWERFVCVDFDGDGTEEVYVDSLGIKALLYYIEGKVYMVNIHKKTYPDKIYKTGICESSPNINTEMYYRLYPAKGAIYREIVAERLSEPVNNYYYIMDEEVAKEEYDAYVEEISGGLTPLEWHEFTEENIDKYVVD